VAANRTIGSEDDGPSSAQRRRLDHFKPSLGDVAIVLAFTGLRWEEAAAVPVDNVRLETSP
jgi:hypothetical protein